MSGREIPQPPQVPIFGNARELDPATPSKSVARLFSQYGSIVRLNLVGTNTILVGSQDVLNELCNEKRFKKKVGNALVQVRNGVGDGLFTAFGEEPNWAIAHRILMPAFGPMAMNHYFDEMKLVASEMLTKWARLGPSNVIDPTDAFTRFTLDSIALCAMDTRFNSFDRHDMHPFVEAMGYFLRESGARSQRPEFVSNYIYRQDTRKYWESVEVLKKTAKAVIDERLSHPSDKKDLLAAMLEGEDPKTGKKLPEENIVNNMITFLIAGHETTSGLLSFLFVNLLQNPRALKKLQEEVDSVLGTGPILPEHMNKLHYLTQCIRESLRLYPTASAFQLEPISTETSDYPMQIGKERWLVNQSDGFMISLPAVHRDPVVWGEDAEQFKPERMSDEKMNKLPPNSWKPFGNGARACIGRAFAWQEAHMLTALLLQNFTFRAEDPSYKMEIQQTLTIKPKGFHMYATLREGVSNIELEHRLWGGNAVETKSSAKDQKIEHASKNAVQKKPMAVFYGSNTGTCEALAQSLAGAAASHGYDPKVKPLDSAVNSLPKDTPIAIITASYEGEPPDNAARFVEYLKGVQGDELKDVKYSVFGCGHTDWQATYQKIPTLCDDLIEARGGARIAARGFANAAENDIFNEFDAWADSAFWPGLVKQFGGDNPGENATSGLDVEIVTSSRTSDLRQDVSEGIITKVQSLTAEGEPEKRHIEILLPSGMSYNAGDYLAVLPINHGNIIKSVMARFQLLWDAKIKINEGQLTFLPTGKEIPIYGLLASYVELSQPATTKHVAALAHYASDSTTKTTLISLTPATISEKHISVLDLLESYPDISLPFGDFLSMLPPMRVRQYSISSSPLADAAHASLTYGVLDQEAKIGGKRYQGTCSTYLSSLRPGDKIYCAVKPSSQAFHLPLDVENVPVIMACAGSGLAPFHGFVAERAAQIKAGRKLAPALLFVGCRHPGRDALYRDEFKEWEELGAVSVRYAFSKAPESSEGCRYMQERLAKDAQEAKGLWMKGARFFVCGNNNVGEGVKEVVLRTAREGNPEWGDEEAQAWFAGIKNERFASDVFA